MVIGAIGAAIIGFGARTALPFLASQAKNIFAFKPLAATAAATATAAAGAGLVSINRGQNTTQVLQATAQGAAFGINPAAYITGNVLEGADKIISGTKNLASEINYSPLVDAGKKGIDFVKANPEVIVGAGLAAAGAGAAVYALNQQPNTGVTQAYVDQQIAGLYKSFPQAAPSSNVINFTQPTPIQSMEPALATPKSRSTTKKKATKAKPKPKPKKKAKKKPKKKKTIKRRSQRKRKQLKRRKPKKKVKKK